MPAARHTALAAAMLLAACSAPSGPERVVEPRLEAVPAPRGAGLLRNAMLSAHARARTELGLPPLQWDETLTAAARDYARDMARTGRFAHAEQPPGPAQQGENLFTGTRRAYRYEEMAQRWIDEKRDFVPGITPAYSRTGRWQDVSHYAQMVWRTTTRIGCATAANARDDYLVCRYYPPGNVVGQRAY